MLKQSINVASIHPPEMSKKVLKRCIKSFYAFPTLKSYIVLLLRTTFKNGLMAM